MSVIKFRGVTICQSGASLKANLPIGSSTLDPDLRAPYLGNFSADIPSGNSQFEASQTNSPMASSRLDADLRVLYLGRFSADIFVWQLDASPASFS